MAKTRREIQREATIAEIKQTARELMAQHGTTGLSVRAIGRQMGMSATALYRYYASLDDLITALIYDNFNALADTLEAAQQAAESNGADYRGQITSLMLAYRKWALDHPTDFQLLYGNPIPGYDAPGELTVPAASRSLDIFSRLLYRMLKETDFQPQPQDIPASIHQQLLELAGDEADELMLTALYTSVIGWSRMHGIIMLELFDHIQPVVGDVDALYHDMIDGLFQTFGL